MERRQGLYILGKTGTGKTTLIDRLVVEDMQAGLGLCVLDPHGDLIDAVAARVPPGREEDVVLLDVADTEFPFGLNLFGCNNPRDEKLVERVATQAVQIFKKLWGDISWGPRVENLLRHCAYTLIENQGYTLAEIPLLLLDQDFRNKLTDAVTHQPTRQFWRHEYPLWGSGKQLLDRVESTLNKINQFLSPTLLPIVGFGRRERLNNCAFCAGDQSY